MRVVTESLSEKERDSVCVPVPVSVSDVSVSVCTSQSVYDERKTNMSFVCQLKIIFDSQAEVESANRTTNQNDNKTADLPYSRRPARHSFYQF